MLRNLLVRTLVFKKNCPWKHEKITPKVGSFSRISVISEIFPYCPTAQTVEFMFLNVAYKATVYRSGARGFLSSPPSLYVCVAFHRELFSSGCFYAANRKRKRTSFTSWLLVSDYGNSIGSMARQKNRIFLPGFSACMLWSYPQRPCLVPLCPPSPPTLFKNNKNARQFFFSDCYLEQLAKAV